ncbi:unnamed protein product [Symbiodinium pilosum]|uniref:C3H1-type domain-containing protein n=1 Tax=Symbiodinium pilosum TaxID=2952 RepID=A0A812YK21_SYMPI|nr:unnamed protein product [Symbiodinium pilosum]
MRLPPGLTCQNGGNAPGCQSWHSPTPAPEPSYFGTAAQRGHNCDSSSEAGRSSQASGVGDQSQQCSDLHPAGLLGFCSGSFGHPHLCSRPCVHIAKGGTCPSGAQCTYCHLPHSGLYKPDRHVRRVLSIADNQELLATFLPFVIKKARREGLLPKVSQLIELLKAEVREPPREPIDLGSFRPMKITFMHLVDLSMRRLPDHIMVEVHRLKSQMPPPQLVSSARGWSVAL